MKTTLQRWGNSQGVRIPKSIADTLGINVGAEVNVEISTDGSKITITPAKDSRPVRGRHRIADLVASCSPSAFEGECAWGEAQGKEVW